MTSGAVEGCADLRQRETALTDKLAASDQQLAPLCEALLERSQIRSLLRDREGALEDAQRARALFPARAECLVRVTQALLDAGHPGKAFEALKKAGDAPHADASVLNRLDRQLRPFERLPDEIVAHVFGFVMEDYERLPSPFQVAHVCQRWRSIANSTPDLWRNLRILRVWDRAVSRHSLFFPRIRKAFTLGQEECPKSYVGSVKDLNHHTLIERCAKLSRHTLSFFEVEVSSEFAVMELIERVLANALDSYDTLKSVRFVHTNNEERERLLRADEESKASEFATHCLNFLLQCPSLVDVELSVGEILQGPPWIHLLLDEALSAAPTPSYRRLKLDSFDGFRTPQGPQAREILLQRAARLHTLVLNNVPDVDLGALPDRLPFALQLLANCATTLTDLEISGHVNVLRGMKATGHLSFPALRRFCYGAHGRRAQKDRRGDLDGMSFPQLEVLEAPADVIAAFPIVPANVTLRLDSERDADLPPFSGWLLDLEDEHSPQTVTILVSYDHSSRSLLDNLFDVLTPSRAGRVACPRLKELRILCRSGFQRNEAGNFHSLQPVALPRPLHREEWFDMADASRAARMERERRRVSQGLEPVYNLVAPPPAPTGGSWTTCEALSLVEFESCWISRNAWAKMKESPCDILATPTPDDMASLSWESVTTHKRKREEEAEAQAS